MPTIFRFGGYRKPTPSLFGDGSDGDFYLAAGETHIETVTVPHQSVVEKNYKSLTIEAGALYQCSDCNAGLVIRVRGDCTIHGTIDQSGKAPKTNPNNNYPYPADLVCGDGGDGGDGGQYGTNSSTSGPGGVGMPARAYGGGYGAGGGSGAISSEYGNAGGDANTITIDVPTKSLFVGRSGKYGGGGKPTYVYGYNGEYFSNEGGSGNYGGGVVMLYVGGVLKIDGSIKCDGMDGEAGGEISKGSPSTHGGGGGGGAGGGGCVYIMHNDQPTITGLLSVSGGVGGAGAEGAGSSGHNGSSGADGTDGTTIVKQYIKGMTA